MTIGFNSIPSGLRVPGTYVEIDGAKAITGLPAQQQKILLVGQRLSTGTVAALDKRRVTTAAQGKTYFGRGSILANMIEAALAVNATTELWAIATDDAGGSTARARTITITGPATAAGTLALLVEGVSIPITVASAATATTVATAIAAAINALPDLTVTATSAAGVVTVTSRNKGAWTGNTIQLNYYQNEQTPAGLTVAIAESVAGATNPSISTVFAQLGDEQFQTIVVGWTDAATMTALDSELTSRWGPVRQIEGQAYVGYAGTFSELSTFGAACNSPFTTIAALKDCPVMPHRLAAATAAVAALSLQIDPARPLTGLAVAYVLAPLAASRFTRQERELLLKDGISTYRIDQSGTVLIERLISTYQVNSYGLDDVTWLDITTSATLAYLRYSMRNRLATKYPRHKLAGDDANFGAGQAVVTPKVIRAELIALAREWEEAGLVENIDGFINGLVVERDATNVNQLNVLATPDIVNGLLTTAVRVEFVL